MKKIYDKHVKPAKAEEEKKAKPAQEQTSEAPSSEPEKGTAAPAPSQTGPAKAQPAGESAQPAPGNAPVSQSPQAEPVTTPSGDTQDAPSKESGQTQAPAKKPPSAMPWFNPDKFKDWPPMEKQPRKQPPTGADQWPIPAVEAPASGPAGTPAPGQTVQPEPGSEGSEREKGFVEKARDAAKRHGVIVDQGQFGIEDHLRKWLEERVKALRGKPSSSADTPGSAATLAPESYITRPDRDVNENSPDIGDTTALTTPIYNQEPAALLAGDQHDEKEIQMSENSTNGTIKWQDLVAALASSFADELEMRRLDQRSAVVSPTGRTRLHRPGLRGLLPGWTGQFQ